MANKADAPPCRTQRLRDITTRQEVYEVLKQASHLEHGLACLYLYAAFSLRKNLTDFPPAMRDTDEKRQQCELIMNQNRHWAKTILFVARQEMEHLGIDQNLINAIGDKPYFLRPNFPIPGNKNGINIPYYLERFSKQTITRFARFEKPEYLSWPATSGGEGKCAEVDWVSDDPLLKEEYDFHSVEDLYESLLRAFENLPPGDLFIGNSQKQVVSSKVQFEGKIFTLPVFNRETAKAAIEQVVEQGEGVGLTPVSIDSHFERFATLLSEMNEASLKYPPHDFALPALCNPNIEDACYHLSDAQKAHSNVVTAEPAFRLMLAFNDAYNLMVVMLKNFYYSYLGFYGSFPTFAHQARNQALNNAVFFPFMTMIIRPLGELIMRTSAGSDYDNQTAGPSFQMKTSAPNCYVEIPLDVDLKYYCQQFDELVDRVADAYNQVKRNPPSEYLSKEEMLEQLSFLSENIRRMRRNFENDWTSKTGISI